MGGDGTMKTEEIGSARMVVVIVLVLVGLVLAGGAYRMVHASDTAPAVGSVAPNFTLTSQEGKAVSLDEYRGKWVVLYFYPKDFTSGCTTEAHNFQRDLAQYQAKNAVIVGVSVQNADSHKQFCAKEGLNFKLLADVDHKVSETYRSTMDHDGTILSARNTFLIGPDGLIRKEFIKV